MSLPAQDLGEAVRKLTNLRNYMDYVPKHVNPNPEEVYQLGYHVARELAERKPTEPLQAADYHRAVLSHRRGSHLTPSREEMFAVAEVVFPGKFVEEIKAYLDELDRASQSRRPPH